MVNEQVIDSLATHLAMSLYATKSKIPDSLKKHIWSIGYFDVTLNKTESLYKLVLFHYIKILSKHHGLKHISTQNVHSDKIRANIYQYDFLIDNKPFNCLTVGNSNHSSHPLMALADSILAYEVVHGCEQCGYIEEGCERCGFNKARRLLASDSNLRSFRSHSENFWEVIGEERRSSLLDLGRHLNANVARVMEDDCDEDENLDDPDDEFVMGEPDEPSCLLFDEEEVKQKLFSDWSDELEDEDD